MQDATGTMNIMIFDKPAKKLVGVSAEELIEDTAGEQISAVISSHHQSRALLVGPHRGGFMVMDVLNDDELQVSSSVKMEWEGGGESSQDEVSSAPVCSSSRLV